VLAVLILSLTVVAMAAGIGLWIRRGRHTAHGG
jgi:hypothetical protein